MKQWFVANTKSNEERKALFNIRRQGFVAYLPQYKKTRRHARKIEAVLVPLFPKYLFVQLNLDHESWSCINSTIGVKRLVQFGNKPAAIPAGLVREIKSRENGDGVIRLDKYLGLKASDAITVINGAFSDHTGIFESQNDDERVVILLNLMGRDVRVRLSSSAISA